MSDVQFDFDKPMDHIDEDGVGLSSGQTWSPYALEVGYWEKVQGRELAHSPINKIREANGQDTLSEHEMTDAFAALYNSRVTPQHGGDPRAIAWWKDYLASDAGRRLRQMTVFDYDATEIASWSAAGELKTYLVNASNTAGTPNESEQDKKEREDSASGAAENGVQDNDLASSMWGGTGQGSGANIPREDLYKAFQQARSSKFIRKVLNCGGRMLKYALARREELLAGNEQSNGITTGKRISRLTSSERMKLMNPQTQASVIERLENNTAMLKHKVAFKQAGRGPVVAVVDESGSMNGSRIIQAKGIACALAWLARIDKRWVSLVGFSCHGQINTLTMSPDEWDQAKLMKWVEHNYSGGTSFDVLPTIAENWEEIGAPRGKTDLLFITDGHGYIDEDRLEMFQQWRKAEKVQCLGLAIEESTHGLEPFCDQAWEVNEISETEEGSRMVLDSAAAMTEAE